MSRYTVLGTMILSPVLLIWDLGRPERFYNMLRVLKLRSPMSTQSWSVFAFGTLSGLISARQAADDGLLGDDNLLVRLVKLIPARFLTVLAMPVGLNVGSNTGNLISATSVPLWARNWLFMGPTFLASGLSTALSWLSLILHLTHSGEKKTLHTLHRAEKATLVIEAGLIAASLIADEQVEQTPLLQRGRPALRRRHPRRRHSSRRWPCSSARRAVPKSILASVLALAGGLAFRFAIIKGGSISADDPEAYFTFASGESAPQPEDNI